MLGKILLFVVILSIFFDGLFVTGLPQSVALGCIKRFYSSNTATNLFNTCDKAVQLQIADYPIGVNKLETSIVTIEPWNQIANTHPNNLYTTKDTTFTITHYSFINENSYAHCVTNIYTGPSNHQTNFAVNKCNFDVEMQYFCTSSGTDIITKSMTLPSYNGIVTASNVTANNFVVVKECRSSWNLVTAVPKTNTASPPTSPLYQCVVRLGSRQEPYYYLANACPCAIEVQYGATEYWSSYSINVTSTTLQPWNEKSANNVFKTDILYSNVEGVLVTTIIRPVDNSGACNTVPQVLQCAFIYSADQQSTTIANRCAVSVDVQVIVGATSNAKSLLVKLPPFTPKATKFPLKNSVTLKEQNVKIVTVKKTTNEAARLALNCVVSFNEAVANSCPCAVTVQRTVTYNASYTHVSVFDIQPWAGGDSTANIIAVNQTFPWEQPTITGAITSTAAAATCTPTLNNCLTFIWPQNEGYVYNSCNFDVEAQLVYFYKRGQAVVRIKGFDGKSVPVGSLPTNAIKLDSSITKNQYLVASTRKL